MMSSERYIPAIAAITSRPISEVRQRCRAAREAGFLPSGKAVTLAPVHVARIIVALACERVIDVGPTITAMRLLPSQSPDAPPGGLEAALTALVINLPKSPVLCDLDIATGHLAIDVEHQEVTLHVHDLFGKPAVVRFAATPIAPPAVTTAVIVPIATLRELARSIL
jgi:hypothetical protein